LQVAWQLLTGRQWIDIEKPYGPNIAINSGELEEVKVEPLNLGSIAPLGSACFIAPSRQRTGSLR
jgi:hypothetical protein